MNKRWKKVFKYAKVYYKLEEIFNNIEIRVDEQSFNIEEHKPTEKAVKEMMRAMKEEGINDKEDMLRFIMQTSKGQANPKLVKEMLG